MEPLSLEVPMQRSMATSILAECGGYIYPHVHPQTDMERHVVSMKPFVSYCEM